MSKIIEMDLPAWELWVASRPATVQALCRRLPPDRLYKMQPHGQRVTVVSYSEDGTVTVVISKQFNEHLAVERRVRGIEPNVLEECEWPDKQSTSKNL